MNEEQNRLLKKEAKELLKRKGMTRGENYLTALFIKKRHGQEGVKMTEEKMSELLNRPFSFPKGRPKEWYPEARDVLITLTAKYLFDWQDKDIVALGEFHALQSFTMKILMRYFISIKKIFKESPKYWEKHFDFSRLEPAAIDEEKKFFALRIRGYKFHPIMCRFYEGYFYAISKCCLASEKVSIKETKCVYAGDPYDEFLIKW